MRVWLTYLVRGMVSPRLSTVSEKTNDKGGSKLFRRKFTPALTPCIGSVIPNTAFWDERNSNDNFSGSFKQ
jgi:hypothetical protein